MLLLETSDVMELPCKPSPHPYMDITDQSTYILYIDFGAAPDKRADPGILFTF